MTESEFKSLSQPPEFEINAGNFVRAVEEQVVPAFNDLRITADNVTKEDIEDLPDVARFARSLGHFEGEKRHLARSKEAEENSATMNQVAVIIKSDSTDRIRGARSTVDALARQHNGFRYPKTGEIRDFSTSEIYSAAPKEIRDSFPKWTSCTFYAFTD